MKLHELEKNIGATHRAKRKGLGRGSGNGKTSGRGQKGQNSRSGGGVRANFEGGQIPLYRRLPKRGFHNHNRVEYLIVNVEQLNLFENDSVVDAQALVEAGLIKEAIMGIKVLGNGELTKKLTVKANKFSESAKKAIEAAGGSVEVM